MYLLPLKMEAAPYAHDGRVRIRNLDSVIAYQSHDIACLSGDPKGATAEVAEGTGSSRFETWRHS